MNKELIAEIEKIIVEFSPIVRGRRCIGGSQFKDLAEAIAKVVEIKLPEKNTEISPSGIVRDIPSSTDIWNACIDEVKLLNKI